MNKEPFDYEKYKAGRKAVTRDGRVPEQLTGIVTKNGLSIVGTIEGALYTWEENGRYICGHVYDIDLFLLPEVREVWVAVDEEHGDFVIAGDEQETERYILSRKRYKKAKLIIYG